MKKSELARELSQKTGATIGTVEDILTHLPAVLAAAIKASDDEKVVLPGVATLKVVHRAARKGRNPATGAEIQIAASSSVTAKVVSGLSKMAVA
jgi:DNA-binding protein HU-beta